MDESSAAVPDSYRGVWTRTLLETPQTRDDQTFVRWLQTSRWHADLRVPLGARSSPEQLAMQQGFCGITTVERTIVDSETERDVCSWHRRFDFQPTALHPDAGHMVFETSDRVIETGVHGRYREVWERLADSTGRYVVLQSKLGAGTVPPKLLLIAGNYLMRVRPRAASWPQAVLPGDSLNDVLHRHPADGMSLLEFEISFGRLEGERWSIERSTLPSLEGRSAPCRIELRTTSSAVTVGPGDTEDWSVLEWSAPGAVIG